MPFGTHHDEWKAARAFRRGYFLDKLDISDPYEWTFAHKDHVHFVLYEGGEIVGYAHVQVFPDQSAVMRVIAAKERQCDREFERQLLQWVESWVKSKNYQRMHIEVPLSAASYYRDQGYTTMPLSDPDRQGLRSKQISMVKVLISVESMPSKKLLSDCARAWGLKNLQFVRKMENIVFACDSGTAKVYLRLTSPLRRGKEEIRAEIDWMEYLGQLGLSVPRAVATGKGDKIVSLAEGTKRFEAVVFTAMTGAHPSKEEVQGANFLSTLGRLIAKMHRASTLYDGSHLDVKREEWFEERGLRHALQAAAHSEESAFRDRLEEMVAWMKQLPRTNQTYGLIHADLGALNLFVQGDGSIGVIDFDDCCHHWFVFDLAIVIFSMAFRFDHEKPSEQERVWLDELLKGYREIRPLTREEIALIPKPIFFACLRLFFWIEYHQCLSTFDESAAQWVVGVKKWVRKRVDSTRF